MDKDKWQIFLLEYNINYLYIWLTNKDMSEKPSLTGANLSKKEVARQDILHLILNYD